MDENKKKLARRLVVSWRWIKQLRGPMFCPLVPTILNIGQFLDEPGSHMWMQWQWFLAYACALQCMVEAMPGRCWLNKMPKSSIRVTDLVKVFMNMTEVQHPVVSMTPCSECLTSMTLGNTPKLSPCSMTWPIDCPASRPSTSWCTLQRPHVVKVRTPNLSSGTRWTWATPCHPLS